MTRPCDRCGRRRGPLHAVGEFRLCARCAAARAAPAAWDAVLRVCHGLEGLHRVRVRFDFVQQCLGCGQRGGRFGAVGFYLHPAGERRMYVACERCARAAAQATSAES
jgi:hypothetical protein